MYDNYIQVRLLTDRFVSEGVKYGDIGCIIEVYNENAYEVEFSEKNGITIAMIVAHKDELEPCLE